MADYIKDIRNLIGTRPLILVGSTIIVLNDNNELLLQLRADTKDWGLPGGGMELGETLEETAKRELFEETGLTAETFEFIEILSGEEYYFKYPNGDEVYNVIALYIAKEVTGELLERDGESLELSYFPINDLPSSIEGRAKLILDKYFNKECLGT